VGNQGVAELARGDSGGENARLRPRNNTSAQWKGRSGYNLKNHFPALFAVFFFAFGGRPIGNTPAATSQFGCLHFGQRIGLPATRLTHAWPQRRQSQIISAGIGISLFAIIAEFSIDITVLSM
jgi:hypothetical protein